MTDVPGQMNIFGEPEPEPKPAEPKPRKRRKQEEWAAEGDVDERGFCRACRSHFCTHAQDWLYGKQTSIPFNLPDPGRRQIGAFSDPAISGAPDTQREAAISVYYSAGSDCLRVLELLWGNGERGITDYEIEVGLRLRHQTASARRNQLMNDGWLENSGKKRRTDTGRNAVVWVFTEAGRTNYERRQP